MNSRDAIIAACENLKALLLEKNAAYGDSALKPIKALSSLDARDRLAVRIDDKLNRLVVGEEFPGDDTLKDLAGYCILWDALEILNAADREQLFEARALGFVVQDSTRSGAESQLEALLREAGLFPVDESQVTVRRVR